MMVRTPSLKVTSRCSYLSLSEVGDPQPGPPNAAEERARTRLVWGDGGGWWPRACNGVWSWARHHPDPALSILKEGQNA